MWSRQTNKIDAERCDEDLDVKIDDLNFIDGTIFAVESPADGDRYKFEDVVLAGSDNDPMFATSREV